jgi:hypothetical protein
MRNLEERSFFRKVPPTVFLENSPLQWAFSQVRDARKLDFRRRAVFPDCFGPGDVFIEERVGSDEVTFRLVRRAEVPLAKLVKRKGRLMIDGSFDPKRIAHAVREDRDSR